MASTIDINGLSRHEKLRIMEAIWDDLSKSDEPVESPNWHQEALLDTEQRFAAGEESILEWSEAKKALRSRLA
jgi:hypothetical protein